MPLIGRARLFIAAFDRYAIANGVIAWLFATTAPLAILLAAARQ